jgi:hypothetical protein
MTSIRVLQVGLGPIGLAVARQLAGRPGFDLVGGVDIDPAHAGKDLGTLCGLEEPLGIEVDADLEQTLERLWPQVIVVCTSSALASVAPTLEQCLAAGADVVSSTEELAFPWREQPALAEQLHDAAIQNGHTLLGTGVNPGFAMDTLPIALSAVCERVDAVHVRRVQDAGKRRGPFQRKIGAGLSAEEFARRVESGGVRHVGLAESIGMIADTFGWRLTRITDEIEPKIAAQPVASEEMAVEAGAASGLLQIGAGYEGNRVRVRLELEAYLGAPEDFDEVRISGTPDLTSRVLGGFPGDVATASVLVNAIPRAHAAPPGLLTMRDVPPVYCWPGADPESVQSRRATAAPSSAMNGEATES